MANVNTPTKLQQTGGFKWSALVFFAGYGAPIVLFCVAVALAIVGALFGAVETPAIWQDTGIYP
jgi:hypothetical protein